MKERTDQVLLNLEEEFAKAFVSNDAEAMGRFLADDWIIIASEGAVIDKPTFLGAVKSGTLTHEMLTLDEARVRVYGDAAIVTGRASVKGTYEGEPFSQQELVTDVFVRQGDRWQWVHTHLTRAGREQGV